MHVLSRHGVELLRRATPLLLIGSFVLLLLVLIPGDRHRGQRRAHAGSGRASLSLAAVGADEARAVLYVAAVPREPPASDPDAQGDDEPGRSSSPAPPALLVAVEPDTRHGARDRRARSRRCSSPPACRCDYLGYLAAGRRRAVRPVLVLAAALPAGAPDVVPRPVGGARAAAASSRCRGRSRSARAGCSASGLGQSVQKVFYLPEAHTDFILAVIGEELGARGRLHGARAVRADRLVGPADRAGGDRAVCQAAGDRPHLPDPVPGDRSTSSSCSASRR